MGGPVGKASGRTFNWMSTHLPDTYWSSLSVTSSHTLNMSIQSRAAQALAPRAIRSLEERLTHARFCDCKVYISRLEMPLAELSLLHDDFNSFLLLE